MRNRSSRQGADRKPGLRTAPASAGLAHAQAAQSIRVRRVKAADIPQIVSLDQQITRIGKDDYWRDVYARYGKRRLAERFFLVAEPIAGKAEGGILGFVVGEIRAWEFGSTPCGWVFAMSVDPDSRLHGIGSSLLDAISGEFKKAGVTKMRTMVARDNRLHLLFFRSQEMAAGPYLQLEKDLE